MEDNEKENEIITRAFNEIRITFDIMANNLTNSLNKLYLSPRQYHLTIHGKERVRKKWTKVAQRYISRIAKWSKNGK